MFLIYDQKHSIFTGRSKKMKYSMNESIITRSLYEAFSRWNSKRNYNKQTFSIRPSVLVSSRISFNFLNNNNKKKRKTKKKNISDENAYWSLFGFGNNSDNNNILIHTPRTHYTTISMKNAIKNTHMQLV